jgi:hypothetical protein
MAPIEPTTCVIIACIINSGYTLICAVCTRIGGDGVRDDRSAHAVAQLPGCQLVDLRPRRGGGRRHDCDLRL